MRPIATGTALIVAVVMPGPLTASLAPQIRADFVFGDAAVGLAVAVYYVLAAATSMPSGRIVERFGARRGMDFAAGAIVAACVAIALLARSAAAMVAVLALASTAHAMAGPAVSAMLAAEVRRERHGLAFGAQQAGASIAGLAAGLALPAVAIPFGWRWAFVATALLALAAVALSPRDPVVVAPINAERPSDCGPLFALALVAALASAAAFGFVAFLVIFAVDSGISEGAAGFLLAAVGFTSTAGRFLFGALSDGGRDPLTPAAAVMAASLPGFALLVVGEPPAIVLGALLAGGLGWSWAGALTHAVVERSRGAPAWGVGVMLTGLLAGNAAGPLAIGLLTTHGSYDAAWAMCAGLMLAAALVVVAVRRAQSRWWTR